MILTNIETISGGKIHEHCGLVQDSTIWARNIGRDIMAGFKSIAGGELKGYTELLQEYRNQALKRICQQAEALGANTVINIRIVTSSVTAGATENVCYGTAVRV